MNYLFLSLSLFDEFHNSSELNLGRHLEGEGLTFSDFKSSRRAVFT